MGRISSWIWPVIKRDSQMEYGHSTEVWGLGWFDSRQAYSIHHGRVGHNCNGLIHQVYVQPVS